MNKTKLKLRLADSKQDLINCINDVIMYSDNEVKEYLKTLRRNIEDFPACQDKRAIQLEEIISDIFTTYRDMMLSTVDGGDPVSAIKARINKEGNKRMYSNVSPFLSDLVGKRRNMGGRESTKSITHEEERSWVLAKDIICLQLQLDKIKYERKFHQQLIEYYDDLWAEDEENESYYDGLIEQEEYTIEALDADEARCLRAINDNKALQRIFGTVNTQQYMRDNQYRESTKKAFGQLVQRQVADIQARDKEFNEEHSEVRSADQAYRSLNREIGSQRERESGSNERKARHVQRKQLRDEKRFNSGESGSNKGGVRKSEETSE